MTEEEARTKWCPHARVTEHGGHDPAECGPAHNRVETSEDAHGPPVRFGFLPEATYCIGSACMAWRWEEENGRRIGGYCGLAGKP